MKTTIIIATLAATSLTTAFAAEAAKAKDQAEITDMVIDELQKRSSEAKHYQRSVQAAEEKAIDRLNSGGKKEEKKEYKTVETSTTKGSDSDDGYKSLQETARKNGGLTPGAGDYEEEEKVEDFKLNENDKSKRDKAPGFIQIIIDAWDFITFWN